MSFTVQAVSRGFGIGLLAEELVKNEIEKKQIIPIGTKPLFHPLFLVQHKNKKLSHLENAFVENLLSYFG